MNSRNNVEHCIVHTFICTTLNIQKKKSTGDQQTNANTIAFPFLKKGDAKDDEIVVQLFQI